ncbi:unnamed protein product [Heterobilharzia americana]|nr:unnamed protein product [Heterobilharzia americana]
MFSMASNSHSRRSQTNKLPFLDVLVKGQITESWKPKCTGSQDTLIESSTTVATTQQRTKLVACRLLKRARTQCSIMSRKNEENYMMSILKKNGYSRNFIRKCLSRTSSTTKSSTEINKCIVLLSIKNVSEIATRLPRPLGGIGVALKGSQPCQLIYL